MTKPIPGPPGHLSASARALYGQVMGAYLLEPHHRAILVKSLEALDRSAQARAEIGDGPLLVTSRLGDVKAHPLLAVERDNRSAFLAGIKQLGLDLDALPAPSTIRANRGGR